jgi:hypothetical protein
LRPYFQKQCRFNDESNDANAGEDVIRWDIIFAIIVGVCAGTVLGVMLSHAGFFK